MTGMPFYLEKGPSFSVIESYVLDDRQRGVALLQALRRGGAGAGTWLSVIAEQIGLDSSSLAADPSTAAQRVRHLNEHWFEQKREQGAWVPDDQPDRPRTTASGDWNWWHGYAGDVYEIMRQTMISAGEVSLGIGPKDDPDADGRADPWPIEIFWHCGQSWFEGWVTWRRNGPSGQVTVLLATPSAGTPVRPSPLADAAPKADQRRARATPYADDAVTKGRSRGMVVVTHRSHQLVTEDTQPAIAVAGRSGYLDKPHRRFWQGQGPVVKVMPSEPDGGVLPGGRPYEG